MTIFKCQSEKGSCIIKINKTIYKPVVELIYLLCTMYESVYIVKPNTSNTINDDRYIVCKQLKNNTDIKTIYKTNFYKLLVFFTKHPDKNIYSILEKPVPYYFINKLDEINIILGQQQLECFNQIISILKHKNKEDKIEMMKKTNIQKSVSWCEKYKIPCNKFVEKINIFLPVTTEIKCESV